MSRCSGLIKEEESSHSEILIRGVSYMRWANIPPRGDHMSALRPTKLTANLSFLSWIYSYFAEIIALVQRIATTSGNQVQLNPKQQHNWKTHKNTLTHARGYFCTRPILKHSSYIQWWGWKTRTCWVLIRKKEALGVSLGYIALHIITLHSITLHSPTLVP